MRAMVAVIVSLYVGVVCAEVLSETSKDVGYGFREVIRSEQMPPAFWEGVGHFHILLYKDRELSRYDTYSIAPSGRYALFQDGPTGALMLFTPVNAQQRMVAKYSGSLARQYTWNEGRMEATIMFENGSLLQVSLIRRGSELVESVAISPAKLDLPVGYWVWCGEGG
jgi:hypothetical protein